VASAEWTFLRQGKQVGRAGLINGWSDGGERGVGWAEKSCGARFLAALLRTPKRPISRLFVSNILRPAFYPHKAKPKDNRNWVREATECNRTAKI
jgi:hypothetical protein